ncbi:MAG: DsbA family protein [Candidatus Liptonbacteria bacterium]|nr:DsbA family protein [Candidatus Liptonbacteria bacterium]
MSNELNSKEAGRETALLLPLSILIAGILVAGAIIYAVGRGAQPTQPTAGQPAPVPAQPPAAAKATGGTPAIGDRDVILGDPKAKVTISEFGDYQCPWCARFFEQIDSRLREDYVKTGKVKVVFHNLAFLGPESLASAQATECAKDQSKFWPFHDAIYTAEAKDAKENNGNLNRDFFVSLAGTLQMDTSAFASCIDSKKYESKIQADNQEAGKYGVNSTPTTFVNGQLVKGASSYDDFKAAIEAALKG